MLVDDANTVILAAGGAVCAAAAVLRAPRRVTPAVLGVALILAAAADAGHGDALWDAAAAASVVGLVLLVVERLTRVSRLSWLDAAMGATAVGALALALDAAAAPAIALGGAAGALALSRWRPGPAMLLTGAGVLCLAFPPEGAAAAAMLFCAGALRREPRIGPGPEFSWTVLAAVIVFAVAALALLGVGQFSALPAAAAVLAMATVVAGMARAGITVTERLRESERRAHTDDLTGLSNRRHLLDRLDAAVGRGDDLALLLIDLDGFKELNDTLGHHAGDEVLRQIGPRLMDAVREHDTMARLGGDEFAFVLLTGDEAVASAAGMRLRAALDGPFQIEGVTTHVGASVGIALHPAHAHTALGLLQRADVAMYEAKRMRTGHEVYLAERDRHSRERLALVGQLRAAIPAGQLVLHYQPKADLATGAVRGVEALVRWAHPEHGLISPASFLPIAEQSALSRTLTKFVLERALVEIGACRARGLELAVAVNLGPPDLLDLDLPSEVARLLGERRFPAAQLTLEVSEDLVMADPERTLEVLARLREVGVVLALDDFGAGHSSLALLKELRVDELKIDRMFVMGMADDPQDAAIVRSTVDLGRRLGLRVVAEGVADADALALLAACRCHEGQGFYISPPLPVSDLEPWLRAATQRVREGLERSAAAARRR
jgi:diguanylate cyclase